MMNQSLSSSKWAGYPTSFIALLLLVLELQPLVSVARIKRIRISIRKTNVRVIPTEVV